MSGVVRKLVTVVCLALWAVDPWIAAHAHQHSHVLGDGSSSCTHSHQHSPAGHSHDVGDHGHHHHVGGCGHSHNSDCCLVEIQDEAKIPAEESSHGPHEDCAACRHEVNVACPTLYWVEWQVSVACEPLVFGEAAPAKRFVTFDYSSRGPPAFCA